MQYKRNERRDIKVLNTIGNYLINHTNNISAYTYTRNEDYVTDITLYDVNGANHSCEVKTIRSSKKPYKSPYIKDYPPTLFEEYNNFWFLNCSTKSGDFKNSKWWKIDNGFYDCVIFYDEDKNIIYYFTNQQIKESVIGYCDIYLKHTTDYEDKNRQWEKKVIVDLSKATKTIKMKTD